MLFGFTLGDMNLLSSCATNLSIVKSLIRVIGVDESICGSPVRERHQILFQMNLFDSRNFLLRFWINRLVVFQLKLLLLLDMLAINQFSSHACYVPSLTGAT